MTKEQIFEYFYTNSANLGIKSTTLILLGGLVIGLIIYLTYWVSYRGVSYNRKFNLSLIVLLEISIVIMLMISSNIVISLGMVGALSIIRFRTAIKDSRETVFIFWAIAEGLSVGSQNFKLSIVTTIFIAILIIAFELIPKIFNKYLLVVKTENKIDLANIMRIIQSYAIDTKIRTVSSNKESEEMIIEIKTKGELDTKLIKRLEEVNEIKFVNYIIEDGENVG